MKKLGVRTFLVLLILMSFALPVWAGSIDSNLHINDAADILTPSEQSALEQKASKLSQQYGVNITVVTVSDLVGTSDAQAYAQMLFKEYHLGVGSEESGILLMLAMNSRDYALIAHGEGNQVLTDYGREQMLDDVLPYLKEDQYAQAFQTYLDIGQTYLHAYFDEGEAVDRSDVFGKVLLHLAQVLIPVIIGFLTVFGFAQQMKTAHKQQYALQYLRKQETSGGSTRRNMHHQGLSSFVAMSIANDDFLYTTQKIIPIVVQSHSSGGTTIGSGGFSGSSGKF